MKYTRQEKKTLRQAVKMLTGVRSISDHDINAAFKAGIEKGVISPRDFGVLVSIDSMKMDLLRIAPPKPRPSKEFFISNAWRVLRFEVLRHYKHKCMSCGRSPKEHGVVLHVDHIKPRSTYPDLALDFDNLQILCEDCNIGKGNKSQDDLRP